MKGYFVCAVLLLAAVVFGDDNPGPAPIGNTRESPFTRDGPRQDDMSILPINNPAPEQQQQTKDIPISSTKDFPSRSQGGFTFPQDADSQPQHDSRPPQYTTTPTVTGCTKEHSAVCASNGRTYNNFCEFSQEQRTTPELRITRRGEC